MCSQNDDPTQYDGPVITRPRKYELSGSEPKPSIALAVIGDMLDEAEREVRSDAETYLLRLARQRIAQAEAEA